MRIHVLLACSLAALSCAQPPRKEVAMAAARVEAARRVDAAVFAPELFKEAESSLAEATRALSSKADYRNAIRAAALAIIRADEALSKATVERTVVLRGLRQLDFELEGLLEMAALRGAREKTPRELEALRARYESFSKRRNQGDFLGALEEGSALKPDLLSFERGLRSRER
jgi:hypothetical protein